MNIIKRFTTRNMPSVGRGKDKALLVMDAFELDYCNADAALDIKMKDFTKIPITDISTLGSAFSSLAVMIQESAQNLTSVNLAGSGKFIRAVGPNGFRVASMGKKGLEQQALLLKTGKIGLSTSTLFLSIALMGIQQELKALKKMQIELLEIIERDKKSQLMADMEILSEYAESYKYYWENAATVMVNLNQVKNIRRNARKDMFSYREETEAILAGKMDTILNHGAAAKINQLTDRFAHYRLALYVYGFSSYLEVLLARNFDPEYLEGMCNELRRFNDDYRGLYSRCYDEIEITSKTALGARVANGMAATNKFLGRQLGKIGFVRKTRVDDFLENNGSSIERKEADRLEMIGKQFSSYNESGIAVFAENLNSLNKMYNEPVEVFWDKDNVYVGPA